MKSIIYKIKIVVIVFTGLLLSTNIQAQGIDDFGIVWNNTFEFGHYFRNLSIIQTNDPNDKGYLALGGGYPQLGFQKNAIIVEFDEQGNELRKAIYTLPPEVYTFVASDANFSFGIAFKTNDGGILAFGEIIDTKAKTEDIFSAQFGWLKQGVVIVKFDKDLKPTKVERVRGSRIMRGKQLSDGNVLIGGLDYGGNPITNYNITLLRKYNQQGALLLDVQSNYREINFLNEDSSVDTYLATTPDRILRINATSNQLSITSFKTVLSLGLPEVLATNDVSVSPASGGGYFLNTRLDSHGDPTTNYQNGYGTYRLDASDNLIYDNIQKPGDKIYRAPYLLPGTTSTYIGTCHVSNGSAPTYISHVYELIDGSSFNARTGIELPKGTTLHMASRSDGFLAAGGNLAEGAIVAKLSSCIKFKINNVPTNNEILVNHAPSIDIDIPLNFEGAKAPAQSGVKYDLQAYVEVGRVNNITSADNGGQLENLSNQSVVGYDAGKGEGKALDLKRKYEFAEGPVVIKYILSIKDSYTTAGVLQSCGQTYTFYLRSVPQTDVVAMPTIIKDGQGGATIKTSIKNVGLASFISPFNITVYKDALGDPTKLIYSYAKAIAPNETVDFEIVISDFDTQFAGATKIVVNFNDNSDGTSEQAEYDPTVERDYEVIL